MTNRRINACTLRRCNNDFAFLSSIIVSLWHLCKRSRYEGQYTITLFLKFTQWTLLGTLAIAFYNSGVNEFQSSQNILFYSMVTERLFILNNFKMSNFTLSHNVFYAICVLKSLTHSLIHHSETVPNSKELQMTTEMWLSKDFKIQIALKTLWKKVKLLIWAISPFPAMFS